MAENLAFDEALAKSASACGRHVLRFWWGGPPAVVMGSNEHAEQVVDAAACARLGVDVLKRCSGGGAVLQTSGVLNYSLVTPAPDHLNLKAGFRLGTDVICAVLAAFGITGVPQGTSDVAIGDRKISGNAQARRWKAMLVHGTLLVDFDFELAEAVLHHPPREPQYRRGRSHRDFLITLRELGIQADRRSIERVAIQAARHVFGNDKTGALREFFDPSVALAQASPEHACLAGHPAGTTLGEPTPT
ncbi:MAG TPA: lipoate--protein ligase family protein [Terriglobales bacterium]|nr:lipoate--protein ligase family protein [Terriglobales bacterium]